jgi:hypothetical protein
VVRDHRNDVKVASTVSIVIITFVSSWLPSFVADMTYFRTVDNNKLLNSYSLTSHVVFWMIYISPSLNPIIYAMHNTTIRRMVLGMIKNQALFHSTASQTAGPSITSTLNHQRISSTSSASNLDLVKNINPVHPFRKRASSIVGLLRIPKTINRNKISDDEISDEVIRESDGLCSDREVSENVSLHSILNRGKDENKPKKKVSICVDGQTIYISGEPEIGEASF